MFTGEIYVQQCKILLKKKGMLLYSAFSCSDECGINYEGNIYGFRQDSDEVIRYTEHENIS
jgi:hypothetical protein